MDVRFGAHSGLKSDITALPKSAMSGNLCRRRIVADVTAYTKKKGRLRRRERPKFREETPQKGSDSWALPHNAI